MAYEKKTYSVGLWRMKNRDRRTSNSWMENRNFDTDSHRIIIDTDASVTFTAFQHTVLHNIYTTPKNKMTATFSLE
jgi:hypothetical protein